MTQGKGHARSGASRGYVSVAIWENLYARVEIPIHLFVVFLLGLVDSRSFMACDYLRYIASGGVDGKRTRQRPRQHQDLYLALRQRRSLDSFFFCRPGVRPRARRSL
ncbi:hypothetical protein MAPG_07192 [Magnaporthiopsis poae ATCC 64411]|uniref:Uncharacterized protein n=1 Tax=Magnaporthiopsis poae (strain ATCC 64411 / 73-15) TaxID=644358 RepID=A0A0C4E406_MAGP6|nr:hypothetical protein MAPG_07192 [Magnaporthiopsis poae ATCC 64411]